MNPIVAGRTLLPVVLLIAAGYTGPEAYAQQSQEEIAEAQATILSVMDAQVEAWNEGKIRAFMDGYAHTDSLLFLSGGEVRRGWEEAYYAYVRNYPDRDAMGTLSFSERSVRVLSDSYALVHGRWRLERENDTPGGLFTLLFAREGEDWKIIHDHTSSE